MVAHVNWCPKPLSINGLLGLVYPFGTMRGVVEPRIVPREEHSVSRRDIDPDALKVLYRLRQYEHVAYLVGGSVRDLLLGRRPKDFDIGTSEEDAFRRDFTINALFYDIATFSVIDYVGGLEDLRAGVVRAIGDPDVRFREDPVRMMRAI